jgi:phosphatidylinositol alpha-mannosyltransferase
MGDAARAGAERFAWPTVAGRVVEAYEDALAMPEPSRRVTRLAVRAGVAAADGPPYRQPPRRLVPLDPPDPEATRRRRGRAARRAGVAAGAAAAVGLAALAAQRVGADAVAGALVSAAPTGVLAAFALMCLSLLIRAEAWHAILRAALPGALVRRGDVARATMIGVLMSATLPARLGEPARALVAARALGRVRERLPVVLGTLVSQTLLNLGATAALGAVMFATVGPLRGGEGRLVALTLVPVVAGMALLAAPTLVGARGEPRSARLRAALGAARRALAQARRGLDVFTHPRLGAWAALAQAAAWGVQWLACWALLGALGLDERAGAAAAAGVLFAVNVTAILPVTPSNVGIYQAACVAVLSAYGVGATGALAYGIILQALEVATAVALGLPALLREGMSWRDMRASALHATPVPELGAAPRGRAAEA